MSPGRRRLVLAAFVAASVLIPMAAVYRHTVRKTPKGQQALVYFRQAMIPVLKEDFNRSRGVARVFVVCTPQHPERARILQQVLEANPAWAVKVFLTWQPGPVTATPPSSAMLGYPADRRVFQFWDVQRVIATTLKLRSEVAAYSAQREWQDAPPVAAWTGDLEGLTDRVRELQ